MTTSALEACFSQRLTVKPGPAGDWPQQAGNSSCALRYNGDNASINCTACTASQQQQQQLAAYLVLVEARGPHTAFRGDGFPISTYKMHTHTID